MLRLTTARARRCAAAAVPTVANDVLRLAVSAVAAVPCAFPSARAFASTFGAPCFGARSFSAGATPPPAQPGAGAVYTQKIARKKSTFRDRVRLHVSGGRGGNGCSSYDTDPYGRGGPDGANGGRGGDVYLVSTSTVSAFTMDSFHLKGQNGRSGGSCLSKGANGYSLKLPIPAGTVVSEIMGTDPKRGEYTLKLLADMDRPGLEIKVATGGSGGLGNRAFKTMYRKQARFSTVGSYGSAKWLHLELKCIADVGLVGYPNAGKSSFLAAVSNATPEIANYPFTTLAPQVGVVELGDMGVTINASIAPIEDAAPVSIPESSSSSPSDAFAPRLSSAMSRLSVADLPGLISGAASENRGLGHEFLKHIQRTRVLCYVLDLSGNDDRDPIQDFLSLQQELQLFDPAILLKPAVIIANKTDNTAKHKRPWMNAKLAELASITTLPVLPVSCLKRVGLEAAVTHLATLVSQQAENERAERLANMQIDLAREQAVAEEMRAQALTEEHEHAEALRARQSDPRNSEAAHQNEPDLDDDEDEDAEDEDDAPPPQSKASKAKRARKMPKSKKKAGSKK